MRARSKLQDRRVIEAAAARGQHDGRKRGTEVRAGADAALSDTVQDYLKAIYKLQTEAGRAATSALAKRLDVAAPTVTATVKKLAALGFVEHEPYKGARLTRAGEKAAIEVIRHHRLLEQYLAQALGLSIEAVHAEAERLEHALSRELEARIDEALGFPTHDPHGDPIPAPDLVLEQVALRSLASLAEQETATVRRVPDHDSALLRYLASLRLLPGRRVEVVRRAPFAGPLTLRIEGSEHAISHELAAQLSVA